MQSSSASLLDALFLSLIDQRLNPFIYFIRSKAIKSTSVSSHPLSQCLHPILDTPQKYSDTFSLTHQLHELSSPQGPPVKPKTPPSSLESQEEVTPLLL